MGFSKKVVSLSTINLHYLKYCSVIPIFNQSTSPMVSLFKLNFLLIIEGFSTSSIDFDLSEWTKQVAELRIEPKSVPMSGPTLNNLIVHPYNGVLCSTS